MIQIKKVIDFHTFSITARDRGTGSFGVAVATARPNVGSLVPWVSPRGAIATQARVNTDLGRQGLALLAQGVPVDVALSALLRKDSDREIRQVHGLDGDRAFCHTGASCVAWCGHDQADEFTIAGNMASCSASGIAGSPSRSSSACSAVLAAPRSVLVIAELVFVKACRTPLTAV